MLRTEAHMVKLALPLSSHSLSVHTTQLQVSTWLCTQSHIDSWAELGFAGLMTTL